MLYRPNEQKRMRRPSLGLNYSYSISKQKWVSEAGRKTRQRKEDLKNKKMGKELQFYTEEIFGQLKVGTMQV